MRKVRGDILLRIAICDDNLPITTEIESMLHTIGQQDCISMEIDIYFDGKSLYQKIQSNNNYDIIYMDIEMDGLDGIQTAQLIRARNIPTLLIYVSAYDMYLKQLFEVEPFRFISKPIDFHLFYKYFNDAYTKICDTDKFFTFSFHQKYTKVPISSIVYFESCGRDIVVHGLNCRYRFLGKLNTIEKHLKTKNINFLRIHQSYLINPHYISSITLSSVELLDDTLRISPKYQDNVRSQYLQIIEGL